MQFDPKLVFEAESEAVSYGEPDLLRRRLIVLHSESATDKAKVHYRTLNAEEVNVLVVCDGARYRHDDQFAKAPSS